MLWTILAILLVLWLLGCGLHIAGAWIHLLLLAALLLLLGRVVTRRPTD